MVKADGVKKVTTDQSTLTATVEFDPSVTTAQKVADHLSTTTQYKATVKS